MLEQDAEITENHHRAAHRVTADARRRARLVDVTMLYAPRSGGVKRYLTAKRSWLGAHRPGVEHALVVPGAHDRMLADGVMTLQAPKLPFGDGYRWPSSLRCWSTALAAMRPDLIEAGDPYVPGQAALEAGQSAGCPVIGFCHSDPAALAALHFGDWARRPVEKRWARLFSRFDRVIAPSRYIAQRLESAGVRDIVVQPLGVETGVFEPRQADREALQRSLGLGRDARLLVFAGRPAREKNIDVLIEAVQKLGAPYHLVLAGAGLGLPREERVISLPYEPDPKALARLIASCDAFVHANDHEPFGLVVLEAMACGVPVVGVNAGGVAETVDSEVGELAAAATPVSFAEAVAALFDRDVKALGDAARTRAVERYAWDRVFTDICRTYAEVSDRNAFMRERDPLALH